MSDHDMQTHATITKAGEIDFPLWAKVIAGVFAISIPIAVSAMIWLASILWNMSERMVRMETQLATATADQYTGTQAKAAQDLIWLQVRQNQSDIQQLQDRLGMRGSNVSAR